MRSILIAGGGTGGHLMPALAIADALVRLDADVEPVLVGARRGVEARILPTRPYRYYLLPAEPIYRAQWWRNLRWPVLAARVLSLAREIVRREQPAVAVGTGGYAAGPPLVAAARARVPLVLQEQNAYPGFTTRRLSPRAAQVHLGFPEARQHLRVALGTAVHTFGNPVAPPPDPRPTPAQAKTALGIDPARPALLVFGGSQGARALNAVVSAAVEQGLFDHVAVLWGTGPAAFDRYRHLHAPPARVIRAFWDPIAEAYAAADLVLSRSGAMTTAEVCTWGRPAVYVPLPSAAGDHQTANARALADGGAAMLVPEVELRPEPLGALVRDLFASGNRLESMGAAAASRGHPKAAESIARTVLTLVA